MKKLLVIWALFLMPAIALADYHEQTGGETEGAGEKAPAETEAEATTETIEGVVGDDGVQSALVVAPSGFTLSPKRIIVKVGVPVELTMKKTSFIVPHKIVAEHEDAGVVFDLKLKRKPQTVTFTPTRVGEYVFYCSTTVPFLKSHRDRGMEGVIEVVD